LVFSNIFFLLGDFVDAFWWREEIALWPVWYFECSECRAAWLWWWDADAVRPWSVVQLRWIHV